MAGQHSSTFLCPHKCTHPEITWSRNCKLHWSRCPTANGFHRIPRFRYKHCTLRCLLPLRSGQQLEQQTCTAQTLYRYDVCLPNETLGQLLWCFSLCNSAHSFLHGFDLTMSLAVLVRQIELRNTFLDNVFSSHPWFVVTKNGRWHSECGKRILDNHSEHGEGHATQHRQWRKQNATVWSLRQGRLLRWRSVEIVRQQQTERTRARRRHVR